jgi:hypothetical protein
MSQRSLSNRAKEDGNPLETVILRNRFDELVAAHADMENFGTFFCICICICRFIHLYMCIYVFIHDIYVTITYIYIYVCIHLYSYTYI